MQTPAADARVPATVTVKTGLVHEESRTRPSQSSQHTLPNSILTTQPAPSLCSRRTWDHSHTVLRQPCGSLHVSPGAQTSWGGRGPTALTTAHEHTRWARRHGHSGRQQSHHTTFTPDDEASEGSSVLAAFLSLLREVMLSPTTLDSLFML